VWWPTNPHSDSNKIFVSQQINDGTKTIMAGMATPELQLARTKVQVEFIVDYNQRIRLHLKELGRWNHGLAAAIHEGLGF
jgi:hypothetical protein